MTSLSFFLLSFENWIVALPLVVVVWLIDDATFHVFSNDSVTRQRFTIKTYASLWWLTWSFYVEIIACIINVCIFTILSQKFNQKKLSKKEFRCIWKRSFQLRWKICCCLLLTFNLSFFALLMRVILFQYLSVFFALEREKPEFLFTTVLFSCIDRSRDIQK